MVSSMKDRLDWLVHAIKRISLWEHGVLGGVALWLLILSLALGACHPSSPTATITASMTVPIPTLSSTPTFLPSNTPSPQPGSTQPPPAYTLYIASYIPIPLRVQISLPESATITDSNLADYFLTIWEAPALSHWVYALVAPFPTLQDGVSAADLQNAWAGKASTSFSGQPLLMDENTRAVFATWWGLPAEGAVQVIPTDELLDYAWQHQPSWAIVPFESLEPRWKVLQVDGQSPLWKGFNPDSYALTVPFGILDKNSVPLKNLPEGWSLPVTNRDPGKLTTVAMTGVTALVRGTALWMERYGITYPADDIGPLLRQADLTHISNEIPFTPDCPYPELHPTGLVFCSKPSYIALLEAVGTDLVELTGDHFGDWGADAMRYTLDMYNQRGWPTYGGGLNAELARQPLLMENNGNKLAFLGCNIGCQVKNEVPCDEYATADQPGAATCDFDYLSREIPQLRDEGYNVIFTFQHKEYYKTKAEPDLVRDFGKIADYGATIVSGSQAHQPHGMAFQNRAFIHYGLGNLFFDQYHFCVNYACDNAFIDRHVFYDNRYLGVELIPIRFVDLAKPVLMTPEQKIKLLDTVFQVSTWFPGN